eukprot:TRINITY_DN2984_c1_g1_i1.p1 TRINITY_DN2984_c1_g1~~TRINITY_DN2984_c1_g1_i1.p1  ORF type:complete len:520 (-),score=-1.73 TRINITY_DN2984_c1_g1_i1:147-1706(-)
MKKAQTAFRKLGLVLVLMLAILLVLRELKQICSHKIVNSQESPLKEKINQISWFLNNTIYARNPATINSKGLSRFLGSAFMRSQLRTRYIDENQLNLRRHVNIQDETIKIPVDFDWEIYLLYYPELKYKGIVDRISAEKHYLQYGWIERRLYRRIKVVLRYTACAGLMNQQYSHISAIALAFAVGAEVVLPCSVKRESFEQYFHTDPSKNKLRWAPALLEDLLDVEYIIEYWKKQGLIIHKTPPLKRPTNFEHPQIAYPSYNQHEVDLRYRTYLPDMYMSLLDIHQLMERVRETVVTFGTQLQQQNATQVVSTVILDCPCTFFAINTQSSLPLVSNIAKSMQFSQKIRDIANQVMQQLPTNYNGIHLRLEQDAKDWETILGGEQLLWQKYIQAMERASFNSTISIYVASGLLTYSSGQQQFKTKTREITNLGLSSKLLHKEQFLGNKLNGLSSEQCALVDFLVLVESNFFVGISSSTFSFYVQEYRALIMKKARSTSVLLETQEIGTDDLFQKGGHLTY